MSEDNTRENGEREIGHALLSVLSKAPSQCGRAGRPLCEYHDQQRELYLSLVRVLQQELDWTDDGWLLLQDPSLRLTPIPDNSQLSLNLDWWDEDLPF
jgi:hypothetical protein